MTPSYVIIVTNTWTHKSSMRPGIFEKEEAEKEVTRLIDKCSSTGKFKNNEYKAVPLGCSDDYPVIE